MAFADAGGVDVVVQEIGPRIKLTVADDVQRGDVLGYSSGWKRALATVGSVVQARYVALDTALSGSVIEVAREAVLQGARFSGAAIDGVVYVGEGATAGRYTQTAPSTSGDAKTPIGRAIAADRLHIRCQSEPDSVA
jgi:hypothetical protein